MKLFSRHRSVAPERRQFSRTPPKASDLQQEYAFRRGRTLTGSVSSQVHSTNESNADLKSSRVHAHMLVQKRRRISNFFLLALLIAGALFVLMDQFTARAVVRASPDPSIQLNDHYAKAISDYLSDHPAERWRFLMSTDRLSEYLKSVTPEVKNIDIRGHTGIGASLFIIELRNPIASWNINGSQLYVDGNGVPFSKNYFSSPSLAVIDKSGVPVMPGQSVASNRFMGFVGQVVGRAKAQGYTVSEIVIPPGMTRQIDVRLDGVVYPIKFSSDRAAGEEVEDMIRAVEWMKKRALSPEYLDVRIKGRVFYR